MKYEQCLSCKNMISGKDTCLYPPPFCDGSKKYELDIEKIYKPVKLIGKVDGFSICAGPVFFSPSEMETRYQKPKRMYIEKEIPIVKLNEEITNQIGDIFADLKKEIVEWLQLDYEANIEHGFNRIVIRIDKRGNPGEEKINKILTEQDKRWPITICPTNDYKGFVVKKNWMSEMRCHQCPCIVNPKKLSDIFVDAELDDRVLISQPYQCEDKDLKILEEFCKKNHLKFILRDVNPYYPGCTKLIIIYEEDVEDILFSTLNIDELPNWEH